MRRKRRKRLRVDRIIIVLVIFILLIFFVRFSIRFVKNMIVNSRSKKSDILKISSDKLDIWDKTINYIKKNKENITIDRGDYQFVIPSSKLKNDMDTTLNIYDEKIDRALFNNVKSLYIESNKNLRNSSSITVKLPRYLRKQKYVDLYGIRNDEVILVKSKIKTDKYISFKTSDAIDDYFLTYIKLKNITFKNKVELEEGEKEKIEVKYNPSNATNKGVTYTVKDTSVAKVENDRIVALKEGKTTLTIKSKVEDVSYIVDIVVNKKVEETPVVEEPKHKIEEIDGITYVDGILIVNKTYSVPEDYDPGDLKDEFMEAYNEMKEDAAEDGINLFIVSGYRSFDYQTGLYYKYVNYDGEEKADTYSARPGHSEHQTGLAADINSADESFEGTPEAIWLDENCYKYGFIIRYPKDKTEYTGYIYEPWHIRYVGTELSNKIHELGGITLEEYFDITSKYED